MVQHGGEQPPDVGLVPFTGSGDVVAISAPGHTDSSVIARRI
ncbi:MAG: hypothetical protein QOD92_1944 [Acidimicrobiaceae bacterium]|jgi:hypothetical protein